VLRSVDDHEVASGRLILRGFEIKGRRQAGPRASALGAHRSNSLLIPGSILPLGIGLFFGLVLRIVSRIDIADGPWPDAMKLNNRILVEPNEVMGSRF